MGMKYINFIATYSCTDYRGNLKKDAAEAKDLKFFSLDDLQENINPPEVVIIKAFLESDLMILHKNTTMRLVVLKMSFQKQKLQVIE